MLTWYPWYIAAWVVACIVALVIFLREKDAFALSSPSYWRFLFVPWKLAIFLIAATGLTVIAPYTSDPTWDYVDTAVMSVLCFATAPWAVGAIYKVIRRELPLKQAFVAFCVWMFTASWFYDAYILWRDGRFCELWLPNIFASSALYVFAGLMWNLDWRSGRGTIFAFMESDWPSRSTERIFGKVAWLALVFIAIVVAMVLPFLFPDYLDVGAWFEGLLSRFGQ